jgi:hypothetical protein
VITIRLAESQDPNPTEGGVAGTVEAGMLRHLREDLLVRVKEDLLVQLKDELGISGRRWRCSGLGLA